MNSAQLPNIMQPPRPVAIDVINIADDIEMDEASVRRAGLDAIQIAPAHIKANGSLHSNPFTGLSEILDNSMDAQATHIKIDVVEFERGRALVVSDDGEGMDRYETRSVMVIGQSRKTFSPSSIGEFGNGLKSGSMRIGKTMLLITKKTLQPQPEDDEVFVIDGSSELTFLMVSLSFLEECQAQKCYTPCFSVKAWPNGTMERLVDNDGEMPKFERGEKLVLKYSPFATTDDLYSFATRMLPGETGSVVVVSDLHRTHTGEYEISVQGREEIKVKNDKGETLRLSQHIQTLYLEPKSTIQILDQMAVLQDPRRMLNHRRWESIPSSSLQGYLEREARNVVGELSKLNHEIGKLNNTRNDLSMKQRQRTSGIEFKQIGREMRGIDDELKKLKDKKEELEKKTKPKKDSRDEDSQIKVWLGINILHREEMRVTFYSNNRRIISVPFKESSVKKWAVFGVSAIINAPTTFMQTTQNRETFECERDMAFLISKCNDIAKDYYLYVPQLMKSKHFWRDIGYPDDSPTTTLDRDSRAEALKNLGYFKFCKQCRQFREVNIKDSNSSELIHGSYTPTIEPMPGHRCPQVVNGRRSKCRDLTEKELNAKNTKRMDKKGPPTNFEKRDEIERQLKLDAAKKKAAQEKRKEKREALKRRRAADEDEDDSGNDTSSDEEVLELAEEQHEEARRREEEEEEEEREERRKRRQRKEEERRKRKEEERAKKNPAKKRREEDDGNDIDWEAEARAKREMERRNQTFVQVRPSPKAPELSKTTAPATVAPQVKPSVKASESSKTAAPATVAPQGKSSAKATEPPKAAVPATVATAKSSSQTKQSSKAATPANVAPTPARQLRTRPSKEVTSTSEHKASPKSDAKPAQKNPSKKATTPASSEEESEEEEEEESDLDTSKSTTKRIPATRATRSERAVASTSAVTTTRRLRGQKPPDTVKERLASIKQELIDGGYGDEEEEKEDSDEDEEEMEEEEESKSEEEEEDEENKEEEEEVEEEDDDEEEDEDEEEEEDDEETEALRAEIEKMQKKLNTHSSNVHQLCTSIVRTGLNDPTIFEGLEKVAKAKDPIKAFDDMMKSRRAMRH